MKLKHCFIVLFFWFFLPNCFAAPYGLPEGKLKWKHIGVNQGLPSSETYFVYQDKKGYIWICTDRGVVRYDGSKMKLFTTKKGLTDDVVFRVYEDFKGRIWFITYNGLLCYYDKGKIIKYKYNYHIVRFLNRYVATYKSFRIDRNETIYYSLKDLGGFTISKNGKFKLWKSNLNTKPALAFEKVGKDCFFAYNSNLGEKSVNIIQEYDTTIIYEINKNKAIFKGFANPRTPISISSSGLYQYMVIYNTCYDLKNFNRNEKHEDLISISTTPNYLWLGKYSKGVERINHTDFARKNRKSILSLKNYSVTCVLKDKNGGYWFSTLENGVFYSPSLDFNYWDTQNKLHNKEVLTVRVYNKHLLVASLAGYQILHPKSNQFFKRAESKPLDIWINRENKLILGGYTHLQFHSNGSLSCTEDHSGFFGYLPAEKGFYMLGIDAIVKTDLYNTDTLNNVVLHKKNGGHYDYNSILEIENDVYYLSNGFGLFRLKNGKIKEALSFDKRARVRIDKALKDDRLGVVVATRGIGVYMIKNNKIWMHLDKREGLIDDNITDIHFDQSGDLYCSSYKGISRIRFENNVPKIVNITKFHGLISNEVESIDSDNKFLWVGTKNGLVSIPLDYFNHVANTAPLVFESIDVNGQQFQTSKSSSFDEGKLNFKLNFRSLEYRSLGHHKFRYRFSKNEKWNYTDRSTVVLSHPQSGDYAFEVAQLGLDGTWGPAQKLIQFSIIPPFYKQWYFFAILFIIGLFIVIVIYRRRLKNVNNKFTLQKRVNELEQKALSAQMNPHFIFNSLNSIQSFLLYQENDKAEKYLLKFSKLIRATLANSRETFITIEQEIDLLKNYLELEQMRFQNRFDFEIETSENLSHILIPPMLIQPFVENAILHGLSKRAENGLLQISFIKQETFIQVRVSDNGVGLNKEKTHTQTGHRSFGSDITKERMAIYEKNFNKSFRWEMNVNSDDKVFPGVEVIIEIPINE